METIKIAGAGPAGLSAAINLARKGYKVDVFEKNQDVGGRFHGDFQGLENWSDEKDVLLKLKEMNISINFDQYPFKNLIISNGMKNWDFKCDIPAFYLIKRGSAIGSLDNGLKKQALDKGVHIHFETVLHESQADIVATGPYAPEKFATARGIVFQTNLKDLAIGLVNDKTAVKGYSYLLVAQGQATMGTVLFDKFKNLNRCFQETKRMFNHLVDLDIINPHPLGGLGSFSLSNIFKKKRRLYAGEAAGLQDLLWGFGIKNAITSGFLAAKSIINGENYEKTAEKHFNHKLKASLVNRFLWEKFGIKNYEFIVNQIHSAQDPLKYLNWIHNFNILQNMIYPMALRYMRDRYRNLRLE